MQKTIKLTESSDLFNEINALPLLRSERMQAMGALETADNVAAATFWVVTKCRQFSEWLNPHPKFKPE
jgi:hypothetical protein